LLLLTNFELLRLKGQLYSPLMEKGEKEEEEHQKNAGRWQLPVKMNMGSEHIKYCTD
jgi:hypothetical protein